MNGVNISKDSVDNVTYKGTTLKPELLSERVAYKENSSSSVTQGVFNYVYEADGNTKVYFDDRNKAFIIGNDLIKTYLTNEINRYKKVTIPQHKSGSWTYKEIYQSLYNGKWYDKDKKNIIAEAAPGYGIKADKKFDYSAINYCVESYIVTEFLNSLGINNAGDSCICGYNHGNSLAISSANNPELEDSDFSLHKRGIIKNVIESNLNQAMTSYSRNSSEGDYKLPKLTETDWDQILRNVSIITFIQNIPIGMKYYNNYAIATSTMNKEYVDPEEIYLNATGDNYYHMPYCKYFERTGNMIGYRSIDYVQKSYTQKKETGEDETKYYYKHSDTRDIDVNQACYYCLVQKSLYEENKTSDKINAYNTALARERYVARMAKLPPEIEASYYIRVTPYTIEEGKEIEATTAQYSINGVGYTGKGVTRINKKTEKYEIKPGFGDRETLDEGSAIVTTDLGGYGAAKETTLDSQNDNYSVYQSNSNATVIINSYNENGINFNVAGKCEWTAGYSTDTTDMLTNLGPEADGYINIKLKYTRNYTDGGPDSGITATANIDSSDTLTIVTNTRDITGYVRLRFTNKNNEGNIVTYYSENIFNVKNANSDIYCKIEGDYNWYNNNWKVEILNVAGETIKEAYTSYYTIRDVAGLKGFSNAVNGTEGPETGAKTLGRTFKVIEDISRVGDMAPIAGKDSKWFDGEFDGEFNGKIHTISDVRISNEDNTYTAFGLFGWVGKPAKIENLIIEKSDIKVSNNSALEQKTGGLAGFCDKGESINNITVKNSTIAGGRRVGGITGESEKEITNCNVDNVTIYSVKEIKEAKSKKPGFGINIGGISGHALNNISKCNVKNSRIGGDIKINTENYDAAINYYYYVGGIIGIAEAKVENISVDNKTVVKVGTTTYELLTDSDRTTLVTFYTYTGGAIGYNKNNNEISSDSNFSINCRVIGNDNVGGIIGWNNGGNINGLKFTGTVSAIGENIGGIVGCNVGGKILNCTNTKESSIETGGKSVGGIVGLNYDKDITNCTNNTTVKGNKNVGGIVGLTYKGTIMLCKNKGEVKGTENSVMGVSLDTDDMAVFCNIVGKNATGTGGIAGKIHGTTISCSYNESKIECNYNGGGIVGIAARGTIEYSYNRGVVTNKDYRNVWVVNRLGGICGAGAGIIINACYNIGEINGQNGNSLKAKISSPLKSPVGGIVGFLLDNQHWITTEEYFLDTKYLEIKLTSLTIANFKNELSYCYNAGDVIGDYDAAIETTHYNGGIIGFIVWGNGSETIKDLIKDIIKNKERDDKTNVTECYYKNSDYTKRGTNNVTKKDKAQVMSDDNLKRKLYEWADSLIVPEGERDAGEFIYNTIAPVETGKGYEGYGVLWWEIENYTRLTSNMFLCNKHKEDGIVIYDYTNFKNAGYNQAITLINSENKEAIISFKNIPTEMCKINESFNGKPVKNETGCYRWIMMIPKGKYGVKGTTDFSKRSQFFNYDSLIHEGEQYDITISNDTTLYIAPILEVITDRFDTKSIEVQWKREYTLIERYGVYNKPDFTPRTINVNAYYDRKPCSSKYSVNGKTVSVELDKIKTEGLNNTTAYLDDYTYYTVGFFKMQGPHTKIGDTEEVRTKWAECNVYIPVENLVDRLGSESAQNYILHTAKVNMKYRIRMWCEKGDFGSWWTNPANLKNSTLEYKVTVQRKKQGTSEWVEIKTINIPKEYKKQTSESGNIGNDGYYTFEYEINKEDFSGSLANVNYDDELRVCVWLKFTSKEGNCTFFIDKTDLDITYGPNVIE